MPRSARAGDLDRTERQQAAGQRPRRRPRPAPSPGRPSRSSAGPGGRRRQREADVAAPPAPGGGRSGRSGRSPVWARWTAARRAGTFWKRWRTVTVVPRGRGAGSSSTTRPSRSVSRRPTPPVVDGADDGELGDGGDARQRLAAEAERAHARRGRRRRACSSRGAGRPARARRRGMPPPSSPTRIRRQAAAANVDPDCARAGVERVLDQLLDDRGRPLDHLAGGDAGGDGAAAGRGSGREAGAGLRLDGVLARANRAPTDRRRGAAGRTGAQADRTARARLHPPTRAVLSLLR